MLCKIFLGGRHPVLLDSRDYKKMKQMKWKLARRGNNSYAQNYRGVLMHRLIMNAPEGLEADHVNGNGLDNRRSNLRLCTRQQNSWNTVRAKGYFLERASGKWRVQITHFGKKIHVGLFTSAAKARQAYIMAKKKYHGAYAPA